MIVIQAVTVVVLDAVIVILAERCDCLKGFSCAALKFLLMSRVFLIAVLWYKITVGICFSSAAVNPISLV